jgi:uncharacterized protein
MHISIAKLSGKLGTKMPFSFTTNAEKLDARSDDYAFEGPVAIEGEVISTGTGYRITGVIKCRKSFVCDRCMKPSAEDQQIPFEESVSLGGSAAEEDDHLFDGERIELDRLVRDTMLAYQPLSQLCKPDCKGLCPVCGADLNEGECGCDRHAVDPRLEALEQFFKQ